MAATGDEAVSLKQAAMAMDITPTNTGVAGDDAVNLRQLKMLFDNNSLSPTVEMVKFSHTQTVSTRAGDVVVKSFLQIPRDCDGIVVFFAYGGRAEFTIIDFNRGIRMQPMMMGQGVYVESINDSEINLIMMSSNSGPYAYIVRFNGIFDDTQQSILLKSEDMYYSNV